MFVFVHAQGIKTVHAERGVKKWQNSVHVVVECPLSTFGKCCQWKKEGKNIGPR